MKTLLQILDDSARYLARHGSESPRSDAQWLIAHALGLTRLDLYLQFERPLNEAELAPIRELLKRRATGEPVQYLTGSTEFYNGEILVGPGVLVPRPETEVLVERVLEVWDRSGPVLDLCTGSAAIPVALSRELEEPPPMVAVELDPQALEWARRNAADRPNIDIRQGDLYDAVVGEQFALITANPPYVTAEECAALPPTVRDHEPRVALDGGEDGLGIYRRIVAGAADHLLPGGLLFCEIGAAQGPAALDLLATAGLENPRLYPDYANRDRVVAARKG